LKIHETLFNLVFGMKCESLLPTKTGTRLEFWSINWL